MLRAQKHLTKKEIKKDPILMFIAESYEFLEHEWIKVGSIFFGVLVIIIAGILITSITRRSDQKAYDSTMTAFYTNAPETVDLMTQYVQKHGSSKKAPKVMLELANYYVTQKNYDNAEKYYRLSIGKSSDDLIFSFNAYNGLGAILEERGNFDEAGKTYEDFVSKFSNSAFVESMRFMAGKAYFTAGNKVSAERNFRAVIDSERDSDLKQQARYYIELISS